PLRPFFLADVGELPDPVQLVGRVDGADIGVLVERVAYAQRRQTALERGENLVVHRFLDEQARAGAADMTLVKEDAVDDPFHRLVDGRVVEDDVRRLAAELEGHLLVAACHRTRDQPPDLGGPGESHLVDVRMFDKGTAGVAGARHDVDDAGRQVGLLADLSERERGQRRSLGRLQHHGVAAGQRGCDLPREHQQGKVPWDDLPGYAERLWIWSEARVRELVRPARVVEEVRRHQGDVNVAGFADRLAVVQGFEDGKFAGALLDDPRDAKQILGPVGGAHGSPVGGVGRSGRADGAVHVPRSRLGDLSENLLGGRTDRFERPAVNAFDEFAADEQAVGGLDVDDRPRLGGR